MQNSCKRVTFFILVSIAIPLFILSFVCLGGANDAYGKNHVVSTFDGDGSEDLCLKEERILGKTTTGMFLWHYTSAAVCFSVFAFFLILMLFVKCGDGVRTNSFLCSAWLLLLVVPLTVIPALRMDGFLTGSYWLFFIPYMLLALSLPILFVGCCCCTSRACEAKLVAPMPVGYLLFLAGLILYIIRFDNITHPPPFTYTFILLFPALAFFLALASVFHYYLKSMSWHGPDRVKWGDFFLCYIPSFFTTLILFGVFILPFSLRKDLVFQTSYHFVFIPHYILALVLSIALVVMGIL